MRSLALASLSLAVPVHAQERAELVAEPDDATRLRRWLEVRAERSEDRWAAGLAIANGALCVGAAVGLRLGIDDAPETGWASVALVGVGLLSAAQGIAMWVLPSRARLDVNALPSGPWTERDVGRFEGLLRDAARSARERRRRRLFSGTGLALAAASGIPLLATSDAGSARGRGMGYGVLGGLAIVGLVYVVSGLFESPAEADWREYRRGLMPLEVSQRPRAEGLGVRF